MPELPEWVQEIVDRVKANSTTADWSSRYWPEAYQALASIGGTSEEDSVCDLIGCLIERGNQQLK